MVWNKSLPKADVLIQAEAENWVVYRDNEAGFVSTADSAKYRYCQQVLRAMRARTVTRRFWQVLLLPALLEFVIS